MRRRRCTPRRRGRGPCPRATAAQNAVPESVAVRYAGFPPEKNTSEASVQPRHELGIARRPRGSGAARPPRGRPRRCVVREAHGRPIGRTTSSPSGADAVGRTSARRRRYAHVQQRRGPPPPPTAGTHPSRAAPGRAASRRRRRASADAARASSRPPISAATSSIASRSSASVRKFTMQARSTKRLVEDRVGEEDAAVELRLRHQPFVEQRRGTPRAPAPSGRSGGT